MTRGGTIRFTYRPSEEPCPTCRRVFETPDAPEVERLRAALQAIAGAKDGDGPGMKFVAEEALRSSKLRFPEPA